MLREGGIKHRLPRPCDRRADRGGAEAGQAARTFSVAPGVVRHVAVLRQRRRELDALVGPGDRQHRAVLARIVIALAGKGR